VTDPSLLCPLVLLPDPKDGVMSTRRLASSALLAALVLVPAAACGSSSSGSTPSASTTAAGNGSVAADPNAPEVNAAGDIPDNQVYVAWAPPGGGWSVKVPEGWARTDATDGSVFTDKYNSVEATAAAAGAAPTVDSAQTTEVPAIKASTANVSDVKVSTVNRKAGPAVLITYTADSPANQVTGKSVRVAVERYEFFRNGTEVVLTLSGPVGADNVDPWKTVTDGFTWQ